MAEVVHVVGDEVFLKSGVVAALGGGNNFFEARVEFFELCHQG